MDNQSKLANLRYQIDEKMPLLHEDVLWLFARIAALEADNARLMGLVKEAGEALVGFVYETTHLSPMKPNGDHDCTIKAETLAQARATLAKIKETPDAE